MPLQHIPCAPGAHIGELITRDYLMRELEAAQGYLLSNYHHPVGNGSDEHDLILINNRGLWLLEVKHWFYRIDADGTHWLHNNQQHASPVISIETKAKRIASTLREAGFANISVVGMVILSRHDSTFGSKPPPEHMRKVFRLSQPLITAVSGRDYLFHANCRDLRPAQMQQIAELLKKGNISKAPTNIGNYRLVRELEPRQGYDETEAQHIAIETRRARVKRYHATGYTSKTELRAAIRHFTREVQALETLAGNQHIVRVYDFHPDPDSDDTCWLFLEWIEGQTLQRILEDQPADTTLPLDKQLRILRPLTSALAACHRKGILHRNLTPASVLLADDGTVKLGDFDLARVPGIGTTISVTGQPLLIGKYAAPEIRDPYMQPDERTDLYALGAIWYDMALCRRSDNVVHLKKIADAPLPTDAQEIMRMLLAPQPDKRPASAGEVAEWLGVVGGGG
jgi:serine/threonine protein kinase